MQLSNIEILYKRAAEKKEESITFLLDSKGPVVFPTVVSSHIQVSGNQCCISDLSFYFEVYLDVEHLYSFNYVYMKKENYRSFIMPNLYIGCEPLYEYGNEEENLPRKEQFSTVWCLNDIEKIIKSTIEKVFTSTFSYNCNVNDVMQTFSDLWQNYEKKVFSLNDDDYHYTQDELEKISYFFNALREYEKNDSFFKEQLN